MKYPRIIFAGTNSGVGKTTLTMGLILALKRRGFNVQPFKAGPDYIDTSYHTHVSGRICRNLDPWMLSKNTILELFQRQAKSSDISVIEGAMGLYDGLLGKQEGSSAHLAKITRSPVILIVDARSLSRSAAAIVLGYKEFDREVDLRGVILNNIASDSHYRSIKYAIEKDVRLPVFGFLPKDKGLSLPERHLGLIPAQEKKPLDGLLKKVAKLIESNIDINAVIAVAKGAKLLPDFKRKIFLQKPADNKINIALARDESFNFYYQDNLDIFTHYGANIIEFSPIKDKTLPPDINGIYIGGGFPELFASKLSKNSALRKDILSRAKKGMPIYAECAGLMYLSKNISDFRGRSFPMSGVFDFSVKMGKRLSALGYVNVEVFKDNILSNESERIRGHIFHWSYLNREPKKNETVFKVKKKGRGPLLDGFFRWNVLACYTHLHFGSNVKFARNFISNCAAYAKRRN